MNNDTQNSSTFSFTDVNLEKAKMIFKKYPPDRKKSAVLPLLDLAQRQNSGMLSKEAIEYVAQLISTPVMKVYEVASFYTMFNLKPVGKYHVQVCGTTPCMLRGAEDIMKACEKYANTKKGQTSADGMFTISEVECLGACVDAPVVQINDDYYENLTPEEAEKLLESLKKN